MVDIAGAGTTSVGPKTIETKIEDGVFTILLNRPDRLNAFNVAMRDELIAAFDTADMDDSVRVVLVTGAGRAFCAGGEVAPPPDGDAPPDPAVRPDGSIDYWHPSLRDDGGLVALRIFDCLKPVIGAVNGAAVGFGATVLLPMDIRIGSTKARFGYPFAALGTVPEAAASWFLPRLVGMSRAIEWSLTGDLQSADEALVAGLLKSVHEPEDLLPSALAIARKLADKPSPVSAALTRQMMWRLSAARHPMEAHIVESHLLYDRKAAADIKEGIRGFLEKRRPVFSDRVSDSMPASYPWWPTQHYR